MMDRPTSRLLRTVAATLLLAFVGLGSRAWACVPQPLVSLQPQGSGPAGTEVTVNGIALNGEVEIRWNGSDGSLLATAKGPTISTKVKVPAADPGLYTVVVVERTKTGALGSSGRVSFLVTPGGPSVGAVQPSPSTVPTGVAPSASKVKTEGVSPALAGAGGVLLLGLGGVGGAFLAVRRTRTSLRHEAGPA